MGYWDDPAQEVDDSPDPTRTFWTTVWDYIGGDCGDLPGECQSENEAVAYGEDWVAETVLSLQLDGDDSQEGEEGWPVFHVVRHEIRADGGEEVYDDRGKLLFSRDGDGEVYR